MRRGRAFVLDALAADSTAHRAKYDRRMRYLVGLVLILLLAAGGVFVVAGRMAPPAITVDKPEKFVGVSTPLEVTIAAPNAPALKPLSIVLEQNGKQTP